MGRLAICRICLDENVHIMHIIENTQLQEIYERLTTIPLQTSDMRPLALCYICHAQLETSRRLMLKCLKAEELLTEMLNQLQTNVDEVPKPTVMDRSTLIQLSVSKTQLLSIESVHQIVDVHEEMPVIKEEYYNEADVKLEAQDLPETINIIDSESDNEHSLRYPSVERPLKLETDIETVIEQTISHCIRRNEVDAVMKATLAKTPEIENRVNKSTNDMDTDNDNEPNITCLSTENNFICDICNKILQDKRCLRIHMREHTAERPHVCNVCEISFIFESDLETHAKTHPKCTREKTHFCVVCSKGFQSRAHLVTHIRTHTGERPYVCNVCNRSFNQMSGLRSHALIHSDKKPYTCNVCDKGFKQFRSFKVHARTHTGEKPYSCDVCLKRFHDKSLLRAHARRTHTGKSLF